MVTVLLPHESLIAEMNSEGRETEVTACIERDMCYIRAVQYIEAPTVSNTVLANSLSHIHLPSPQSREMTALV